MCALCGILSVKDRWTEPLKREGVYVRASRPTLRRPAGDHRPQPGPSLIGDALVASSGRSIGSVAKELGLRDSVLRRWVEQRGARREPTAAARRPTTQATLPSADHAAEIARLQRENERLRMERDILKKSIAIFAGVPK